MTLPTDPELHTLHEALESRARNLREEVRTVDVERAEAPVRQQDEVEDSGDQGEQRSRDAVRDAERQRDAAELDDISAALDRMDRGCYGLCVDCGVDIPLQRLTVQPAAARCIACQERHEQALGAGRSIRPA